MKENDVKLWISPYIDKEIERERHYQIEEYLAKNPHLKKTFQNEERLESAIKESLKATDRVRAGWNHALREVLDGEPVHINRWPAVAASFLFCFILFGSWQAYVTANNDFVHEAVKYHKSYVKDDMPLSVETSSHDAIADYFSEQMPSAIECVYTFSETTAKMIGARVCHLKESPVAYVICHIDGTPVSIFIMNTKSFETFKQAKQFSDPASDSRYFRMGRFSAVALKQSYGVICAVGKLDPEKLETHLFKPGTSEHNNDTDVV